MEYITLNNGVKMPKLGLGTFLIPKENLSDTIGKAYELGYRQFDTAWRYRNEKDIARAFQVHGIKREDVFITTKINIDAFYLKNYQYGYHGLFNIRNFKSIRQVIEESFSNLNTEYVDLFLVHGTFPKYREMYSELTKFYKEGRIRAIGVCSCLPPHLDALKEFSDVTPAVNQFEISPLNTQKELIEYCQKRGIAVEAMSTFSHYRSNKPRNEIIYNEDIVDIAQKHHKSTVQVVLRWLFQQNIITIPKTWDFDHLADNISIFDFELSNEEMARIDALDKGKFLNYNPYGETFALPKKYYTNWSGFNKGEEFRFWEPFPRLNNLLSKNK